MGIPSIKQISCDMTQQKTEVAILGKKNMNVLVTLDNNSVLLQKLRFTYYSTILKLARKTSGKIP